MQAENHLDQAKQHFQKTLYLEPNHENSLLQLMVIAEYEGHDEQVERFCQRLQKWPSMMGDTSDDMSSFFRIRPSKELN
ncbi:MAG: hypothetical protein Q9M18_09005 [Mariprofundaceae bacterium]|nr:hypothetical protein [Mariprofundaceae bacterium]